MLSTQHNPDVTREQIRQDIKYVFDTVYHGIWSIITQNFMNPTGRFVIGGPYGDSGHLPVARLLWTLMGRCPPRGGSFSGKDCTKVDRSAAYAARYHAKNNIILLRLPRDAGYSFLCH